MAVSLIVEGAEHTGKSTLCKVLSKLTGTPVIHLSKDTGVVNGKFDYYSGYTNLAEVPSIFDRFYLTEIAYSRFFNRVENIDKNLQLRLETRLTELKYMLVLLDTHNILWDHKRDQPLEETDNISLKTVFVDIFSTVSMPKIKISTLDSNTSKYIVDSWYNYYN